MPGTLRRGLPRVPGGEPWPPADVAVPADAAEPELAVVAPESAVAAPSPALAAPLRADSSPPGAQMTPGGEDRARNPRAPRAAGGNLRRGLPRVAGGEPWPPAAAAVPAEPEPELEPAVAASLRAGSSPPGARMTPGGEDRARNAPAPVAGAGMLRRGLPRVSGGEPWPPATPGATWVPPGPDRPTTAAPQPAMAEPAAMEPAAMAEPAATAEPAAPETGAGELVPATEASAVAETPAGPRPPLPFTPTVWPGAAASGPRGPRPAPRRYGPFTRLQWAGAVVVAGGALLVAAGLAVALVRWWLSTPWGAGFLAAYPGEYPLPEGAPVGFPAWLGWQHFFNAFLIVLIIRSGLQVRREKRPTVFWSPRHNKKRKISLALWFHQSLDILWLLNGAVFVVLLFVTGQWVRIVPTSWEVFPNAVSAALQYVSLNWPTENGWVNYNSLQQLAYFATVFLAAPLAAITGVRMSGVWPKDAATLNRFYPVEWARRIHFPVMIYFVLFLVAHVALVFATGALRNLNHMYAAQDAVNWTGFWIFVASVAAIVAGWVAARPLLLAPIARLFGEVKGR